MLTLMDRFLTRRVSIKVSGERKKVSALEAIVLQLLQRALSGSARALRTLLKYQEFAYRHSSKQFELIFTESDYTRALATLLKRNNDD